VAHSVVQSIMIFTGQAPQQFAVSLEQNLQVQNGMMSSKGGWKDAMHCNACIMTHWEKTEKIKDLASPRSGRRLEML